MADRKASPWSGPRLELHGRLDGPAPICPGCAQPVDGFTSVALDGSIPNPGDVSICFYCAEVLLYCQDPLAVQTRLILRRPEGDDRILILADPKMQRLRAAVLRGIRERADRRGIADG